MQYIINYQKLGLLLSGLTLNGLILSPVEAQIKRVTFRPIPTIITAPAPSGNTGTFSGGFTWNPSLSTASANSVPVDDPGLTYNISFSGTGNGIGDLAGFTLTTSPANIILASSSGNWDLSVDGLLNPSQITSPNGSEVRLITEISLGFFGGFFLNRPTFADLTVFNSSTLTENSGTVTYGSGDFNFSIRVDTINAVPFEFSENFAVLTFLLTLGLGYLYKNRNSFLKEKKDNFNEKEIKKDALEMTNSNK